MPGWIIQGVRGEGKSLAAVGKIREYMLRGRPVATNLNLFLEKFLPEDNAVVSYRLPDHPRLCDFQLLPPAFDPKYKKEDMNGLLVLDELGTWLNARNWNDKSRLEMLNWLFLSRKDHWDIILLAQDYEMIDAQVRTTLCDYLVQASRLDRQKIPYLAGAMKFFGLSGMMPRVHRYHVFYGMSLQTAPVETWSYTGTEFYSGYDTNQKFLNGQEPIGGTLVDMRATYSYVPVNYLTRRVFIDRLDAQIEQLKKLPVIKTGHELEGDNVAKKGVGSEANYVKIGLLVVGLVGFLGWRMLHGGFSMPPSAAVLPVQVPPPVSSSVGSLVSDSVPVVIASAPAVSPSPVFPAIETTSFIDYLIQHFRPRLSLVAYHPEGGFFGNVDFYQDGLLVESYPIKVLHELGVAFIHRDYGAEMIYRGKSYILTAWKLKETQFQDLPASAIAPVESDKKPG